jgi:hypothetical protein
LKNIAKKKPFELVLLDFKSPLVGWQIKARIQNIYIALLDLLIFNAKSFLGC